MSICRETQYLLECDTEDLLIFCQAQLPEYGKSFILPAPCHDFGLAFMLQASVTSKYIFTAAGGLSPALTITVSVQNQPPKTSRIFRPAHERRKRFQSPKLLTAVRKMTVLRQ